MADLIREEEADLEARVVSSYELLHKLGSEDRERILDLLNSRTTADIERASSLRRAAEARLLKTPQEQRSGLERRSGQDRRAYRARIKRGAERRSGRERRSGADRRRVQSALDSGP